MTTLARFDGSATVLKQRRSPAFSVWLRVVGSALRARTKNLYVPGGINIEAYSELPNVTNACSSAPNDTPTPPALNADSRKMTTSARFDASGILGCTRGTEAHPVSSVNATMRTSSNFFIIPNLVCWIAMCYRACTHRNNASCTALPLCELAWLISSTTDTRRPFASST